MTVENITIRDPHSGTTARVLTGLGSNLYSLCVPIGDREVDLLWAAEDFGRGTERPSGSGIPILFPFPGRIAGTGFEWEEKSYALEAGDAFGNAIHGFVYNRPWRVTAQTESSLTTQFQASVDDATILERWPADFKITMVYELHDRTLELRCTVENPDSRPLPFGLGFHPYFRLPLLGGHADECTKVGITRHVADRRDFRGDECRGFTERHRLSRHALRRRLHGLDRQRRQVRSGHSRAVDRYASRPCVRFAIPRMRCLHTGTSRCGLCRALHVCSQRY